MELKVGDKIPDFSAKDTNGNDFDSLTIIGKKAVIIYFYPKDDTAQCTAQACGFRDRYRDFADHDVEVIGISSDSVDSHKNFTNKYNLPFILLSDNDEKIRKLFGVPSRLFGLLPGRVTYLVDEKGVIKKIFDSLFGAKHVSEILGALNK